MINSCDGCRAGMPVVWSMGLLGHRVPMHVDLGAAVAGRKRVHMICCADMYDDEHVVRTTDSGEHGPAVLSNN